MQELIKNILTSRIYEVAINSPLDYAKNLSEQTGNEIHLKREDLQPVFSFKLRGAYNKMSRLSEKEKQQGVICASAGNHAQGVALSAQKLGIEATIVMPKTTPAIKVRSVKQLGGEVMLHGDNYSEAAEECKKLVEQTGKTFIHPFDDFEVIAGQGTIGHELLQQLPEMDYLFVPIGGGGLIAGVAAFLKTVKPETKIIGVEPLESDAMYRSLKANERVVLDSVGIFADGVAVKQVGELTFQMTRDFVDEIVLVSTDEISSAIKSIYEDTRSIMEPAGALAVAGLRHFLRKNNEVRNAKMVAINSGANMNFDRLQFVAERTRTGEEREALFAVTIPETAGSLKRFCEEFVGNKGITEFNYRISEKEAHIFVGIGVENRSERETFQQNLEKNGYACMDLTDNDLAKTHIRHMVGGRSDQAANEVLYMFEFPERPQALANFLNAMSSGWNISLFHYRMHGGDYGRVLVGFQIPEQDRTKFKEFLDNLHYHYEEETYNPAYRLFL